MGGQTDSQVAKSREFHAYHWLICFYNNRLLAINLCRPALGVKTVKNLRPDLSSTEVNAGPCKSSEVGSQTKRKLTQVQLNSCRLASPFGQGLKLYNISKMHAMF